VAKSPTILTRRNIFRAGAGLAVAATAAPLLTPASARAEGTRQAGAEPLNGNGFYRFKIYQATVISDGYGQIPIRPILAMNVSEAELAPVSASGTANRFASSDSATPLLAGGWVMSR
jgi:hypothetical protein